MKRKSREQKLQLATETLCRLDQPLLTVAVGAGTGTTSINPGGTAGCGCTCNSRNTYSSELC